MPLIRNVLRALFRHDAMNREMNEEIARHIEQSTVLFMARGMTRADAERAARREFGNVATIGESARDARGAPWVESIRGEIRHATRGLLATPAFTLVAILSLAIGIGANTAIFSLVNAVMLRSLPVAAPEQLLALAVRDSASTGPVSSGALIWTNPLWESIRDATRNEATYAASGETRFNLAEGGEARYASAMWVNGEYFSTLGVRPIAGRIFGAGDDYRGCPATVVAGEGFWQTELGGSEAAIGRPVRLDGKPYTLVGVVPREFFGTDVGSTIQLYVPLCAEPVSQGANSSLDHKSNWWLRIIARPAPGVSPERLAARLRQVSRAVFEPNASPRLDASRRAEFASRKIGVTPAGRGMSEIRDQYSRALVVLMGMVALVLLISCANVANLMLARGAARGREMAIRMAIGASRWRLVRQALVEAIILAIAGTSIGVLFSVWASRLLVAMFGAAGETVTLDLSPDVRVFGFAAAACLLTVILFGLAPALRASNADPQSAMKAGGRGSDAPGRFRIGKSLVVAQSALALILLVGAGLLVSTFRHLTTADPGFEANGVLIARVGFGRTDIPAAQRPEYLRRIRERLAAVPGVESISAAELTPVSGSTWNESITIEGRAPFADFRDREAWFNTVDSGYFRTMRTRMIAGRDFSSRDTPTAPKVAIVNEAFAKHFFPGVSAVGRAYYTEDMGRRGDRVTIVGVVENTRYRSIREDARRLVFLTSLQGPPGSAASEQLVIRTASTPVAIGALRAIAREADPRISLTMRPLSDQIARSLRRERMLALLSGFFGVLALTLAMVGLYGVMAYTVARRRVEIGIRIALGAVRGRVVRLVLGDAIALVAAGIAIGAAVTFVTVRVLGSLLYGVEARDPWTLVASALLLAASAVVAAALPAGRAASLPPVEALRED
jgi:predicted permease